MERVVLHSDINSCYVSIELLSRPELRGKPVAVAGAPEERHGIILASSQEAKRCGLRAGMAIWQARQLCPELITLPPHYDRYVEFALAAQELYADFTDLREPFGLDESWLDLTGCVAHRDGKLAAEEIRRRMKKELGVTVSVGVSWNKVFAKLGSDYKKPDAVTHIRRDNFRELVWPLPVRDLLFVGPATEKRLHALGIKSIGELARADPDTLRLRLGKNGLSLQAAAAGHDIAPVLRWGEWAPVKSIGNSTTPPRDLENEAEVRAVLLPLVESVAGRLRAAGFKAGLAEISVRQTDTLQWSSHQASFSQPTDITRHLYEKGLALFREHHRWPRPLRGLGFRVADLRPADSPQQTDLFTDIKKLESLRRLDKAVDAIRARFGADAIHYLGASSDPRGFTSFGWHS